MPIISLVTDSLNLFDYDTGIYIPGKALMKKGLAGGQMEITIIEEIMGKRCTYNIY